MIIYIGDKEIVLKQLACEHEFSDVCIDDISRFKKCKQCFVADRDVTSVEQYFKFIEDANEYLKDEKTELTEENKELMNELKKLKASLCTTDFKDICESLDVVTAPVLSKLLEAFINNKVLVVQQIEVLSYQLSDEDSNMTTIGEDYICETTSGTCYVSKKTFDLWVLERHAIRWVNPV